MIPKDLTSVKLRVTALKTESNPHYAELKAQLLEDLEGAERAFTIMDFAATVWGDGLAASFAKHTLAHISMFYFNLDTTPDVPAFIRWQIRQEQDAIADRERYISTLKPKDKGREFWQESIERCKQSIEMYTQKLEAITNQQQDNEQQRS